MDHISIYSQSFRCYLLFRKKHVACLSSLSQRISATFLKLKDQSYLLFEKWRLQVRKNSEFQRIRIVQRHAEALFVC